VVVRRVRAYIGLGANVGDKRRTLAQAVTALSAMPGARVRGVSRLYRTKPVGITAQPDFLNAVVALDVPAGGSHAEGATALLVNLKRLERELGRRARRRWGPRELDLDLLVFGRARLAIERPAEGTPLTADIDPGAAARLLEVPHPSMAERLFVLAPLADLAPGLVPPGWQETIATAARRRAMIEGEDAVRPAGTRAGEGWLAEARRAQPNAPPRSSLR
jgi:2-amino-4-hydroxy-6-hydroxymethyldihydropteridine diphosphokinase